MKKTIAITMLFILVIAPVSQARTLTGTIKSMTIEGTAQNAHDLTEDTGDVVVQAVHAVFDGGKRVAYHGTKIILKVVAAPFYWLEKLTGNDPQ